MVPFNALWTFIRNCFVHTSKTTVWKGLSWCFIIGQNTNLKKIIFLQDGVDLDDLLPEVGEFGRYQKLLICLVCLPACVPCGFSAFNQLFMADPAPHWCSVPSLSQLNPDLRRYLSIPREVGDFPWQQHFDEKIVKVSLTVRTKLGYIDREKYAFLAVPFRIIPMTSTNGDDPNVSQQ